MSCLKHNEPVIKYCQTCAVFSCSKCPSHLYHVTTEYSLFKLEFKSEVDSFIKQIQAKEKLLDSLEAKLTGYISSVSTNEQICLENLTKSYTQIQENLALRHSKLVQEVRDLSNKIQKPFQVNLERLKGYLLEIKSLIKNAEILSEKLDKDLLKDPLQVSNELRNININNFHYIDSFTKSTKSSLEAQIPKIPIVESNLQKIEEIFFLDYNSKLLETKPLFPYWNLDRLLNSLKIKDQGSSITSSCDNWCTAIFKDVFTCGQVSIEILIQKDGSGQKMYVGMVNGQTPGLSLLKSLSSTSGYSLWSYRICGEMHSKNFVYSTHKDKRRYRRGDKVRITADLDRSMISFFKNNEEMYTFTDISDTLQPFVCFGEAFQSIQILSCEHNDPKVIFH